MNNEATNAAFWLVGVNAAFQERGIPKRIDRREFFRHVETALEILGGGTYRGPLVVYEMIAYVEYASGRLTPPLRFGDKSTPWKQV